MQHFIATYGYVTVFLLMVAESACIPIPSEFMTFAGALAAGAVAGTHLNLVGVILAGVAGNVVGRAFGRRALPGDRRVPTPGPRVPGPPADGRDVPGDHRADRLHSGVAWWRNVKSDYLTSAVPAVPHPGQP